MSNAHILQTNGKIAHEVFRATHQALLPSNFYATDADSVLIDDLGPICVLEFKTGKAQEVDHLLSYTQKVFFRWVLAAKLPVFVIRANALKVEEGPFFVHQIKRIVEDGDTLKAISLPFAHLRGWEDFHAWESALRAYARDHREELHLLYSPIQLLQYGYHV